MAKKFIRKLQRASSHSYVLTMPKELVKKFGWKERQKLVIEFGGKKHELKIRDWPSARSTRRRKTQK